MALVAQRPELYPQIMQIVQSNERAGTGLKGRTGGNSSASSASAVSSNLVKSEFPVKQEPRRMDTGEPVSIPVSQHSASTSTDMMTLPMTSLAPQASGAMANTVYSYTP